jgi:trk system potassium uptake protein TrkA
MYLQEMGVKRIIAKALDHDHAKILTKVGATDIVHPEKDMAVRIARELSTPNILDFIPLGKDFTIGQIQAPRSFTGRSLSDLNLRAQYNIYVIAIRETQPENFVQMPPAEFTIKSGDILVVLGRNQDIQNVKSLR